MKTTVRFLIPVAMLAAILISAIIVRWILMTAVPTQVEASIFGQLVLAIFSVFVATCAIIALGRNLSSVWTSVSHSSSFASPKQVPRVEGQVETVAPTHYRPLVGIPRNGVLTLERLSDDPKTRQNIRDLSSQMADRRRTG